MSVVLVFPIAAIAVYMIFRHVKAIFAGKEGDYCGCASRGKCLKRSLMER